jgi:hypothetical protein
MAVRAKQDPGLRYGKRHDRVLYSAAGVREIAIEQALGRVGFDFDVGVIIGAMVVRSSNPAVVPTAKPPTMVLPF